MECLQIIGWPLQDLAAGTHSRQYSEVDWVSHHLVPQVYMEEVGDVLSSTPAHSLSSSQSSRIGVFEGLKYLSISCLELFESKISPLALGTVASPNSQFALETATSNLSRWRLWKTPEVTPNHISESWLRLQHISTLYKSSAWKSKNLTASWWPMDVILPSTLPLRLSQVPRGQSPVLQYRLHRTQMLADWITTWTR